MRSPLGLVVSLSVVLGCVACGDGDETKEGQVGGPLLVFAASSLTDVFTVLASDFEQLNPAVDVRLSFAGSPSLREQVLDGAPADVLASANEAVMVDLVDAGAITAVPTRFASNRLTIAVPADNPGRVGGVGDLGDDDLFIGLCAEDVPCGDLARQLLESSGVEASVDTEEPDVRSLLTKIAAGELDAGIVYSTDVVAAAGDVVGITIPGSEEHEARYPIAVLTESTNPATAGAFVDHVLSDAGRAVLLDHGFVVG